MSTTEPTRIALPGILAPPPRILVLMADFHPHIAHRLCDGAVRALRMAKAEERIVTLPGALEIPPAIRIAALAERFEGFVALGCVIRGETTHYESVCAESARGLMNLAIDHALAIGNGILTVETEAQALRRADIHGLDKGGAAARAALHMVALSRRFARSGGAGRCPPAAARTPP